jgi:hypothetical protein
MPHQPPKEYFRINVGHHPVVRAVKIARNHLLASILSDPPAPYTELYRQAERIMDWETEDEWEDHANRVAHSPGPVRSFDEEIVDETLFQQLLFMFEDGQDFEVIRRRAQQVVVWFENCYCSDV